MTYKIPDHVPPLTTELICYCVLAPNDVQYVNLLSGAISGLSLWTNYDRTTDKAGVQVARVWQGIANQMSVCGTTTIEFRQETGCVLEFRQDGGAWTPIYDPSVCIPPPPDLSDYLIRHPLTNGRNLITTNGNAAFMIDTSNTLFSANHVLRGGQMLYSSYPGQDIDGERYRPVMNFQRPGEMDIAPLLTSLVFDTPNDIYLLNGWSETGTRRYPSFADVSTSDVSHSGALILVHDNVYDRDDLYISEIKSDASFHWHKWFTQQDAIAVLGDFWASVDTAYEELPVGSTPEITFEPVTPPVDPPRTLVTLKTPPFSAAPPSDTCPELTPPSEDETKHYRLNLDAQGTMIPFSVPAGTTLENFATFGLWNIHSQDTVDYFSDVPCTGNGDPERTQDFLALGQVLLKWQPDNGTIQAWNTTPVNPFAGRVSFTDEFWYLDANLKPVAPFQTNTVRGQLCAEFDLVRGVVGEWGIIFTMFFQPAFNMSLTGVTGEGTIGYDGTNGAGGACIQAFYAVLSAECDASTRITRSEATIRGKNTNGFIQALAGVGGIGATSIGTASAVTDELTEVGSPIDYTPGVGLKDLFINITLTAAVDPCSGDNYHTYITRWAMFGTGTRPVFA